MKKTPKTEKQIDTEAEDFAQEVNYAVTHNGREMHPEQREAKKRSKKSGQQTSEPWQVD